MHIYIYIYAYNNLIIYILYDNLEYTAGIKKNYLI